MLTKGNGKLTLTGNLGDVMKESAIIALEYIKSHAEELGLDADELNKRTVHLHVPQGAIPKDGPRWALRSRLWFRPSPGAKSAKRDDR